MPVPDSISVVMVQNSQIAKVFPVFTVSQNVVITKLIPAIVLSLPSEAAESVDVLINTSRGWISVAETPHYSREIKTHTTASLAPNATEKSVLSMYPGWRAFKFSTNRPARVRVYRTAAQRDADESRLIKDDPVGNHGRLLEMVTSSVLSYILSPAVDFASDDVDSSEFYVSVTNLDSVAGTVVTTYDYIRTE